jgi:hypothetical protein
MRASKLDGQRGLVLPWPPLGVVVVVVLVVVLVVVPVPVPVVVVLLVVVVLVDVVPPFHGSGRGPAVVHGSGRGPQLGQELEEWLPKLVGDAESTVAASVCCADCGPFAPSSSALPSTRP